jgi:hypothetical protein
VTMTWEEWLLNAAELRARWPEATFPQASVVVYGNDLADLDAAHVRAAIVAHDRAGGRLPTAGQIRAKVIELTRDDPQWTEALRACRRLISAGWGGPYHRHYEAEWSAVLERLPAAVREFAETVGSAQVYAALNETESGGEARLRDKWREWVARQVRDAGLVGLEAPGLPAVERLNSRPRRALRAAEEPEEAA